MRTLCLFLLVLLTSPMSYAAALDNRVLSVIVLRFRKAAGRQLTVYGRGHFAFLLALPASQCRETNRHVDLNLSRSRHIFITDDVNIFLNSLGVNYLTVFQNSGSRCPECKLLNPVQTNGNRTTAELFQTLLNNRIHHNNQSVGCIILYTTHSPCLDHCFSNTGNCEIIPALQSSPFLDIWTEPDIHKYFVFSKIFANDGDQSRRQEIREKLAAVESTGFHVRRCDGKGRFLCRECSAPEYCIK
ncbi:uncharacterized protein LOC132809937 [Hemiscyllium ocellatum]|uniref:uncharacterized protein LOC132805671 n=1 Tax=Hemiscyllium ocellatum TaxID=170820 RepID=UPI00296709B1|nr:uncharacterized protein LOC132805671 [Hemiscyllium ocellatum]XP_060676841.1 uncharacterized protein LOC132805672 [Hemiscyllium ocellatum]XP_060678596.1 uncharacterized protein LOC132809937 [Hemiscyllium ocellatum]